MAETDEKTDSQCGTDARERTLRGIIPGRINKITQLPFNLIELFTPLFLGMPGQLFKVALGFSGMGRGRTTQIIYRIRGRLLEVGDILLGGRKRGTASFVRHSALFVGSHRANLRQNRRPLMLSMIRSKDIATLEWRSGNLRAHASEPSQFLHH